MNDTELDTRLREWATWAVETAPDAVRPAPGRRRAWLAVAASVVVVLVVVAALLVVRPSRHDSSPVGTRTPAPTLRTAVPAPGMRAVTYHGLTIDVPRTWSENTQPCGPTVSTVYLPQTGAQPACARGTPPKGVTIVEFSGTTIPQVASPTTVDGADASRFSDPVRHSVQVEVPSLQVSVEIITTDADRRRQLLASMRIVDVDAYGCATRVSAAPTAAESVPHSDELLVPINATRLHVCRYLDGLLEKSALVTTPVGVAALSTVFNSLDPIVGPQHSLTAPLSDGTTYLVVADYPTGPPVRVVVRPSARALWADGPRDFRYQPKILGALEPLVGAPG